MRTSENASARRPRRRSLRRLTAMVATTLAVLFSVFVAPSAARADDSSCGFASGTGYVCTYVNGNGTWINHIYSNRTKSAPPEICRSSAWAYYIPPWGDAVGIGYTERHDCVYVTARAYMQINRSVPSGSRVCTKFMEFGTTVGPEPCVTVH